MPCASASLSRTAPSPRSASTPSASSHGDSQRASWNPLSTKTPTASSSSGSVVPPTMTRVTDGVPAGTLVSQGLFETFRQALGDAQSDDVLDRRFADGLHRAEVSQQRTLPRRPDAFHRIERRGQGLARAHLAVVRDREAVRFVSDSLDEKHSRRVPLLDDRLRAVRREYLLALLGQRERRNVGVAGRLQHFERGAQLSLAAVDQDQVWPARERAVADDLSVLAPLCRLQALEPAPEALLQHREVIGTGRELDPEMAVVVAPWAAVLENDHCADGRVALDVGDVVALDSLRRALEIQRLGESGQHRLCATAVVVGLDAQLLEFLRRRLGQLRHERALAAALGYLDRDRPTSSLGQPAG